MLPVIISALFFINYLEQKGKAYFNLFFCGLFSMVAVFIKFTAFFSIIVLPLFIIIKYFKSLKQYRNKYFKDFASYVFGILLVSFLIICYFAFHSAVDEFIYANFLYGRDYIALIPISTGIVKFYNFFKYFIKYNTDLITVLSISSLIILFLNRNHQTEEQRYNNLFLLFLSFFSLVGVFWGRNMFSHYYLQMAFPFALLIPLALSTFGINKKQLSMIIYLSIILIIIIRIPGGSFESFLLNYKKMKTDVHYHVSNYIKENTSSKDTIFVLGGFPIIYFLSERQASNKYFFWVHYKPKWVKATNLDKESSLSIFKKNKPRYIIHSSDVSGKRIKIQHLEDFMYENYSLEAKFGLYSLYKLKR